MLFKPELIEKILREEKTQTRRPALPEPDGTSIAGREMIGWPMGQMSVRRGAKDDSHWITRYQVGKEYSIQPGRGKSTTYWRYCDLTGVGFDILKIPFSVELLNWGWKPLRIRILDIRREDVRSISHEDAIAEGFESPWQFWTVWTEFYDKSMRQTQIEYHEGPGFFELMRKRPLNLYDAWALTFELVR